MDHQLARLFQDNILTDLVLNITDGSVQLTLNVHKLVLYCYCPYFEKLIKRLPPDTKVAEIGVPNAAVVKDIIMSFYRAVDDNNDRSARYLLMYQICRNFLCLPIDFNPLYLLQVPSDDMDTVLTLCHITNDDVRSLMILYRNLSDDFDIPPYIIPKISSINVPYYLVVSHGKRIFFYCTNSLFMERYIGSDIFVCTMDGSYLCYAVYPTLYFYEISSGTVTKVDQACTNHAVSVLLCSPDNRYIIVCSYQMIDIYHTTGILHKSLHYGFGIRVALYSTDMKYFAVVYISGYMTLYDSVTFERLIDSISHPKLSYVRITTACFIDNNRIVLGTFLHNIIIGELRDSISEENHLREMTFNITNDIITETVFGLQILKYNPIHSYVSYIFVDKLLIIYTKPDNKIEQKELITICDNHIQSYVFSPDYSWIIIHTKNKHNMSDRISKYDAGTGHLLEHLPLANDVISTFALMANLRYKQLEHKKQSTYII